jgi:DNA-directed RNA polymerase subunit RPC12/RpoP
MPITTGKRYKCNTCGAEFIVTKGGDGTLRCDGDELVQI